jgi:predicted nucleic acid-binding protein
MILADTSVWIEHFRHTHSGLVQLLESGQVCCHAAVIGELACGHLKRREVVIGLLEALPRAPSIPEDEVMQFLETHSLFGKGLGWVDMQLLASAYFEGFRLWTLDRRLKAVSFDLGISY